MADQNIKPLYPVAPSVDTLKKKKSPPKNVPASGAGQPKKDQQSKKGIIDTYA